MLFTSRYANHRIALGNGQAIQFENGIYRTDDTDKINLLRNHSEYGTTIHSQEVVISKPKKLTSVAKIKSKIADIIIPHHDRHDHLKNCLSRLPNDIFNIIIVSGGSFARNCNLGAKLAKTNNIIVLNDDVEPEPSYLVDMCNMDADIVGAAQIIPDFGQQPFYGIGYSYVNDRLSGSLTHNIKDSLIPTGFLLRVKKKAWTKLKGFDERFINGGEDQDFAFRALKAKMKIDYFKEPVLHHHSQSEGRLNFTEKNQALLDSLWPEDKISKLLNIKKEAITVVIPIRKGGDAKTTEDSLKKQTLKNFKIIKVNDEKGKGANWARNNGFKKVDTEFVLFSDDDITWKPDALETLLNKLIHSPQASYCYGGYEMDGNIYCQEEFNPDELKKRNYVSTMTLIRTKDFPGFDESLKRLQDWDLWLTMLKNNKTGVYCGRQIFSTRKRNGITFNGINWEEAFGKLKSKHRL